MNKKIFCIVILLFFIDGIDIALCSDIKPDIYKLLVEDQKVYNISLKKIKEYNAFKKYKKTIEELDRDAALEEFDKLSTIVRKAEKYVIKDKPTNAHNISLMFQPWSRFKVNGFETLQESNKNSNNRAGYGDRVILHSGELLNGENDLELPERAGIGFSFSRFYRSHVNYNGPLGKGWDHNHNQRLFLYENTNELVWLNGQREISFYKHKEDWQPESGEFFKIDQTASSITITNPGLVEFSFERAKNVTEDIFSGWRIKSVCSGTPESQYSNCLNYNYDDTSNLLLSIIDPYKNTIEFHYNERSQLLHIVKDTYTISYEYDEKDNLAKRIIHNIALSNSTSTDAITDYRYIDKEERSWLYEVTKNSTKEIFEYQLDPWEHEYGRIIKQTFRPAGNSDETVQWKFKAKLNAATNKHQVELSSPDFSGLTEKYLFANSSKANRPLNQVESIEQPSRNAKWDFEYNRNGFVIKEISPLGREANFLYDEKNLNPLFRGNIIRKITKPNSNSNGFDLVEIGEEYLYHDKIYSPTKIRHYQVHKDLSKEYLIVKENLYSENDYRIIKEKNGYKVDIYIWNKYGLIAAKVNSLGIVTLYKYYKKFNEGETSYNHGGLLAETIVDADPDEIQFINNYSLDSLDAALPSRAVPLDPKSEVTFFTYDYQGRIISEKTNHYENYYAYNKIGQILLAYDTRSDLSVNFYNANFQRTKSAIRVYSNNNSYQGENLEGIHGRFHVQLYGYNSLGQLSSWTQTSEPFSRNKNTFPVVKYDRLPTGLLESKRLPSGIEIRTTFVDKTGWISNKQIHSGGYQIGNVYILKPPALDIKYNEEEDNYIINDGTTNIAKLEYKESTEQNYKLGFFKSSIEREEIYINGKKSQYLHFLTRFFSERLAVLTEEPDLEGKYYSLTAWSFTNKEDDNWKNNKNKIKELIRSTHFVNRSIVFEDASYNSEGYLLSYIDDYKSKYEFKPDNFGRTYFKKTPDGNENSILLDGLGRIINTKIYNPTKNKILYESTKKYDNAGNLQIERIRRLGKYNHGEIKNSEIDEWLISKEYEYDASGQITRARSLRNGAYYLYYYDGVGRTVATVNPEGDITTYLYSNGLLVLGTKRIKNQLNDQFETIRSITVYDKRNNPFISCPIDTKSELALERAIITVYDSKGRLLSQIYPGLNKDEKVYNSRDLITEEIITSENDTKSNETHITRWSYDIDGRTAELKVDNNPLVLVTPKSNELFQFTIPFPQTTKNTYDSLGRLQEIHFPDGLVNRYSYDAGSLVRSVTNQKGIESETLFFEYDKSKRLAKILKPLNDKNDILQDINYDSWGNISNITDSANPNFPVTTNRNYDSLGKVLEEETILSCNDIKLQPEIIQFTYDIPSGEAGVHYDGLNQKLYTILWDRFKFQQDLNGRVTSIFADKHTKFADYKYIDNSIISKTVYDSGLEKQIKLSPLLEPETISFSVLNSKDMLAGFTYNIDKSGLVDAYSFGVPSEEINRSVYFNYDDFTRLTGEGSENTIPPNLSEKRQKLIFDPSYPGFWRVNRYQYDKAGNRTHSFRKFSSKNEADSKLTHLKNKSMWFFSPSNTINKRRSTINNLKDGKIDPQKEFLTHKDLASNRLGATSSTTQVSQNFEYNFTGRLTNYKNIVDTKAIQWQLNYDPLGRVVSMIGATDGDSNSNDNLEITLEFAYDAFNRRILKKVIKHHENTTTYHKTIYHKNNPIYNRSTSDPEKRWILDSQYIWGPHTKEIIAAVLPRSTVESISSNELGRYYLHQDRALNVFMSTGFDDGKIEIFDVASFLGFGENDTKAQIESINSSEPNESGKGPEIAYDKLFNESSFWLLGAGEGFLNINLKKSSQIDQLTIWEDNFPKTFEIFIVPESEKLPQKETIEAWKQNAHQMNWFANGVVDGKYTYQFTESEKVDDIRDPYELHLGGKIGKTIVIVWPVGGSMSVREFEVTVRPKNPSSFAFSGSWLDKETGLYYHKSRYRLPSMGGKFISPDPLGYLGGYNLYAYAINNPLSYHDPDGEYLHILAGGAIGGIVGGGAYTINTFYNDEEFSWAKFGIYTGGGVAAGAITSATFGLASTALATTALSDGAAIAVASASAGAAGGVAHGAITGGGTTYLETGDIGRSLTSAAKHAAIEGVVGAVTGGVGGGTLRFLTKAKVPLGIANKTLRGLAVSTVSGGAAGGAGGGVSGAIYGYQADGIDGMIRGTAVGIGKGAILGAAGGAVFFGVGKAFDVTTKATWDKSKREYWRREAGKSPEKYSPGNLERMKNGSPPQVTNPRTGEVESIQLHHNIEQRSGLPRVFIDQPFNLKPVTRTEHAAIDPFVH